MRHWLLFLLSTVLSLTSIEAPSQSLLPIDHFTKYDEFGGIKLSPSGEHAAYMTGKYGRSVIAFIALKDRKLTGAVQCPDGFEFFDFEWASDQRIVYQIAERYAGMAAPSPTGEILAVDLDGKKQSLIYGYRAGEQVTGTHRRVRQSSYATAEVISPLLGDEKNILIAEMPWRESASAWHYDPDAKPLITLLNVHNGNKRRMGVAPLANASVLVDQNDRVRFAVGQNEQFKLAASWKPDPEGPWVDFELTDFREDTVFPQLMSDDNRSVFFTGTHTDESFSALYRLDLQTKSVAKLHAFANGDIDSLIYDLAGKRIIGAVSYADKPLTHWLDENDPAARLRKSLDKAFPGQMVTIVTTNKDGSLAVAFVSSDVNPGDYYLFDTKTMKANFLQAAQRWIVPTQMRPKEPISLQARDGVELRGYVTRPAGSGPHPLVVLPHGGPHGVRDEWGFEWDVQLLANRGYAVLQVNYRGSGGFGERFQELGYREWGGRIQDDITDATLWAIEQKISSRDRICIFGGSFGGYAALQGVVREPTLYQCAIGYVGVYDQELMLSTADIPRSKSGRAYLKTALGEDRELMRSRSPVYAADKIRVPVLLIHGKEDGRVDYEHAKRMKAALEKHGKEFEWMPLSREGHGVYDEATRRDVYERIIAFLDRHLKTSAAKSTAPTN